VAELLLRYLPLIRGFGISADWRLIHGAPEFFTVTKSFHDALQGAHYDLPKSAQTLYLSVKEGSAELLDANYDVIVVHDPQPAAIRHFAAQLRSLRSGLFIEDTRSPGDGRCQRRVCKGSSETRSRKTFKSCHFPAASALSSQCRTGVVEPRRGFKPHHQR
jgi:hypothetical protein